MPSSDAQKSSGPASVRFLGGFTSQARGVSAVTPAGDDIAPARWKWANGALGQGCGRGLAWFCLCPTLSGMIT